MRGCRLRGCRLRGCRLRGPASARRPGWPAGSPRAGPPPAAGASAAAARPAASRLGCLLGCRLWRRAERGGFPGCRGRHRPPGRLPPPAGRRPVVVNCSPWRCPGR
ncbi:MAG: hypothetical protein ACK5QQ_15665 [Cyanobacteriota bacterium]